jgi:hypothetical protein
MKRLRKKNRLKNEQKLKNDFIYIKYFDEIL